MSKFKVGDRVRVISCGHSSDCFPNGTVGTITETDNDDSRHSTKVSWNGREDNFSADEIELVTSKGVKKVTELKKHLYRLKKDTLEYKAGTVVKEQCTDGTQDFNVLDKCGDEAGGSIKRELVVDNPTWFEEVKMEYVPVVKRGRKPGVKKTAKVSTWTPERRAAQSRRMKRIRAARKDTWGK